MELALGIILFAGLCFIAPLWWPRYDPGEYPPDEPWKSHDKHNGTGG